ncbi:SMP-30/gluconolactonase/LRE family protein [Nocardia sp. NPDC052566]|uniref:SMP-30/gluconolactonase/LRE family protein n=1 Tax=Nocardia sp. NPDC052566 TaxID=3364330 RepID=UPI0037C6C87E
MTMRALGSGLVACVLAVAAVGCGSDGKGGADKAGADLKPGVLSGFSTPESVLVVGDGYFVSNVGAAVEPVTKDGDGFLSRLDGTGKVTAAKAIPRAGDPPLNAPKGMAFADNKIFVADIDRVVGYDIDSLGQVFEAPIGGDAPTLLNDIAVLDDKTLLVTDTLRGSVYKLGIEDKKFGTLTTGVAGANGVVVDTSGKIAYVAANGAKFEGGDLFQLDLGRTPVIPKRIGTLHGVYDGIALLPNGNLVVSDWVSSDNPVPGAVTVYQTDGTEVSKVQLPGTPSGTADFTLDKSGKYLLIPAMPENKIVIVAV